MTELIKKKLRKIGTSYGVLLPRSFMIKENLKEGENINLTIFKKNLKIIDKSFGMFKEAKIPFKRDHIDRIERYERLKKDAS